MRAEEENVSRGGRPGEPGRADLTPTWRVGRDPSLPPGLGRADPHSHPGQGGPGPLLPPRPGGPDPITPTRAGRPGPPHPTRAGRAGAGRDPSPHPGRRGPGPPTPTWGGRTLDSHPSRGWDLTPPGRAADPHSHPGRGGPGRDPLTPTWPGRLTCRRLLPARRPPVLRPQRFSRAPSSSPSSVTLGAPSLLPLLCRLC